MNYKTKSLILWIATIIFTVTIAIYQRITGPTYPKSGKTEIAGESIKYKFYRSHGGESDAESRIFAPDLSISGVYKYKKLNVDEEWIDSEMKRDGDYLVITLPHQPMAGKLMYLATLQKDGQLYLITTEPVIIRFRGGVPIYVLVFHALFMFLAMLFSTRTGLEAVIKGKNVYKYTIITIIFLFFGGLIFGPVVQKFAFGAYWTGWPFGQDLTDNKTLIAFIFWVIALIRIWRNREKRGWILVAAIVLLVIFLIPHSMFGSELDYSTGEVVTGK